MTPSEPSAAELPELVALADGLTERDPVEAATVIRSVLGGVRELLGMDVAFVGEFRNGHRVYAHVDADARVGPQAPREGQSDPLETTYCQRIVDGRLPAVVRDAAATPETAGLSLTDTLSVGTHLGVPITFSDGRVYGTFCAFTSQPDAGVRDRDAGTLRLLAGLIARYLERDALRSARRSRAEADVLEVLAVGGLTTVFQPIIDLRSGRPAGFEALARFPAGPPDEWFARAAEADLAVPLELAALDEAVRHVPELPEGTYLSVNVSPGTLCTPQFEARAAGLPLHRLVLELTEQTEVRSYPELAARVDWIRSRGGRVAVDDAGAGYAGLQRIVTISPDILKLDSHFTRGVVDDAARQAMAAAMGWFAERIDAKLVVEGVETCHELAALRRLGVEYVQGYHTGRPMARLTRPGVHLRGGPAEAAVVPIPSSTLLPPPPRPVPSSRWAPVGILPDGTVLRVRPLGPRDRGALAERFRRLSSDTRYARFLHPVARLSEQDLRLLVDDVDGSRHVALVLEAVSLPVDALGVAGGVAVVAVGVGRYVRSEERPDAAEVAFTVDDAWHGRGCGRALSRALADHARGAGIRVLTADVLATNAACLRLLAGLGRVVRTGADAGVLTVEVALGG